jgi:hypothetical protein
MALRDLEAAARILGNLKARAHDPERAFHLEAIRSAIAELRTVGAAGARAGRLACSPESRPSARQDGRGPDRLGAAAWPNHIGGVVSTPGVVRCAARRARRICVKCAAVHR